MELLREGAKVCFTGLPHDAGKAAEQINAAGLDAEGCTLEQAGNMVRCSYRWDCSDDVQSVVLMIPYPPIASCSPPLGLAGRADRRPFDARTLSTRWRSGRRRPTTIFASRWCRKR